MAIVGANGAGKTMLLKLLCRLHDSNRERCWWMAETFATLTCRRGEGSATMTTRNDCSLSE
jgi:ABC-type cobalamin/Fe3+-siderophores transport system ATPase subunit